MTRVSSSRASRKPADPNVPTPCQARFIADADELAAAALDLANRSQRAAQYRPGSPETVFIMWVGWALGHALRLLRDARETGGTLRGFSGSDNGMDCTPIMRFFPRPVVAKVLDMNAYRARRAAERRTVL